MEQLVLKDENFKLYSFTTLFIYFYIIPNYFSSIAMVEL
ncbi:hypothetical protein PHEL49_0056 [Polaribacter sp. Hel1_33_49]|nr:hypothetical protein PHEL49_0056 [Polaribacter sp. Hel1_33_49]